MGTFIWTLAIAAGAALIWRLRHRSDRVAAGSPGAMPSGPAGTGTTAAPAPGGAALMETAAGANGRGSRANETRPPAAEDEPIDGWIEDVSVAPHAAPIDPGSEPSPWRIRTVAAAPPVAAPAEPPAAPAGPEAPARKGTRMQEELPGEETAAKAGSPEDALYVESEWDGDDGERLADPDAGEAGLRGQ
jgi:hypothetical protein